MDLTERHSVLVRKLKADREEAFVRRQKASAQKLQDRRLELRDKRAAATQSKKSKLCQSVKTCNAISAIEEIPVVGQNEKSACTPKSKASARYACNTAKSVIVKRAAMRKSELCTITMTVPEIPVDVEPETPVCTPKSKASTRYKCKKTKSAIDGKQANRDKQKCFIDRIKQDPDKYEKYLRSEHERYLQRKAEGKIKMIGDMSVRGKRRKRRQWKTNTTAYRKRAKLDAETEAVIINNSPPMTPCNTESNQMNEHELCSTSSTVKSCSGCSRKQAGKKKVRKDRTTAYRVIHEKDLKLKNANREVQRLRKQVERLKKKRSTTNELTITTNQGSASDSWAEDFA